MARITNAQLVAQLEAAHVAYEALAAKYEALKAERAVPTRSVYQPRGATPEVLARRAAMAAARDLAIRTGRCVSVSEVQ